MKATGGNGCSLLPRFRLSRGQPLYVNRKFDEQVLHSMCLVVVHPRSHTSACSLFSHCLLPSWES